MQFQKAVKSAAKLRLAITGPSGAGKTFSALRIAKGIGKRIALVDTENHSAALYADHFEFDTISLMPPYTLDKYMDAIKAAVAGRYDVLVVDSISHAWAGEGGLLEKKGAMDVRGGNSYTNWAPITKEHEQFKSLLLTCDINLIVTMRSKQDYIIEISDKGKSAPRKVGLAPIQREGMEYEFTMVLDMAMDHNATVSKTRVSKFDGKVFQPSEETGTELIRWLNDGAPVVAVQPPPATFTAVSDTATATVAAPGEPAWPHPASDEAKTIPEVPHEEAVTFEMARAISEIQEMLAKMNGGDADIMDAQLKTLTKYTAKDGKEKWLQMADLAGVAKHRPAWLKGVHKKVAEEYAKALDAQKKPV